jgi:hypothetical protein
MTPVSIPGSGDFAHTKEHAVTPGLLLLCTAVVALMASRAMSRSLIERAGVALWPEAVARMGVDVNVARGFAMHDAIAFERYSSNHVSYHVLAEVNRLPDSYPSRRGARRPLE